MNDTLLMGCSFTDPLWQKEIPWSLHYSKHYPSYIIAKAGMGIYGITSEALDFLPKIPTIKKAIIMLPTIWRLDIDYDIEAHRATAMVDLLQANVNGFNIVEQAHRKWIICNSPDLVSKNEHKNFFKESYITFGLGNVAKRSLRSLEHLQLYCKVQGIDLHITAIADPLEYLEGIDYMPYVHEWLDRVNYKNWFRFENKFVDKFLGHNQHPTTEEHKKLAEYIIENVK